MQEDLGRDVPHANERSRSTPRQGGKHDASEAFRDGISDPGIFSLLAIQSARGYRGDETPDLASLSDADLKAVTVNFERTRCYGTCAAYAVTIHGDGHVEYLGKDHVKKSGKQEGHVETDTIRALISEFARAKFFAACRG
jgi:hypothetical protein